MKTAIYIQNGLTQLVLTPEGEWEQKVIEAITRSGSEAKLIKGLLLRN